MHGQQNIKIFYKMLCVKGEFRENWLRDGHILLKIVNEFLPYFSHFAKDFVENRHRLSPCPYTE